MKVLATLLVCASLAALACPAPAEEKNASTLRTVSPDKKFAMRIVHEPGVDTEGEIDSSFIRGIELVALPSRKVVAQLLPEEDIGLTFEGVKLLWSPDSQWCAFYFRSPRVGYTQVLRRRGGTFHPVNEPGQLRVDANTLVKDSDGVRNDYIEPQRWTKSGTLTLEQFAIVRTGDETVDVRLRLVAQWDAKRKRFRIVSKKELPPE